ncbi:D-allose transporter subunit [Escherichia coli]|nr:D-allose ABC transporter periplasmic binding protein [Escherichia coli]SQR34737.1 D-allose transporter subunit [Escherichia coli]SQS35945.1 D-allose transporter subunit [Escherichia coli]SRY33828.1 D-allose transporter subunit [Escherichia coli]SRY76099.1 D-allose transporter subunit [Escherichia coli]
MNKYLKYFSGTLVGLMLSTSAFAAAEYAVVLKTLSNPFWVDMKKGIEDEAKTLGVSVDIFASPSEGDFQSQLQLFEDLSNKNYKGIAFAPLSSVGNDSNLLIVFYVQIMPDDFVMQLHRF